MQLPRRRPAGRPSLPAPRRRVALASAALVVAPVLSSCGFEYATGRDYTPGVGANERSGQVDVLGGLVVSAEDGEGVFIASLSNSLEGDDTTLEEMSSSEELTFELEPVELVPGGFANLAAAETPVTVTGDFVAGQFIPVTLSFSHGEQVSLEVPVVPNCGDYAETAGLPAGDEACVADDTAHGSDDAESVG